MTDQPSVRRRQAARILVIDDDGCVLLLHDSDPGAPGQPAWWITPGGGVEAGESPARAAARELQEETGLGVAEGHLSAPVWRRRVTHVFSDHVAVQDETFFILSTARFTPTSGGYTESERASILGHRWWSQAELAATGEDVWPRELATLLTPILAGEFPEQVSLPAAFEDPGGRAPAPS